MILFAKIALTGIKHDVLLALHVFDAFILRKIKYSNSGENVNFLWLFELTMWSENIRNKYHFF